MAAVHRINVQYVDGQTWMIPVWNSGIAQSAMEIMSIARSTCLHTLMLNKLERNRRDEKNEDYLYDGTEL